jgi:hypothetical protein
MKAKCIGILFGVWLATGIFSSAFATVEWIPSGALEIGRPILDFTVSPDGKHFFVLTKGGDIFIYDREGKPAGKIATGKDVNLIRVSADGTRIFLSGNQAGTLEWLDFDFIVEVNVSGSPYRGSPDAPVVMAVFSDFQ